MELKEESLIAAYCFFAKKLYLQKYNIENKSEDCAKQFLTLIQKRYFLPTLGEDFLWRYLVFQFSYWDNLTITSFDRKMKFVFIFGKKALNRYLSRNQEYDWQLESCKVTSLISHKAFRREIGVKETPSRFNAESIYRRKYLNEEDGLAYCVLYTSLCDEEDDCCNQCRYKTDCMEIQRMNYPAVFKQRTTKNQSHVR